MRLNLSQVHQIKSSVKLVFGENAKLWIFGAQLGDRRRTSDVDLYIETDAPGCSSEQEAALLALLRQEFGSLQIEVSIRKPQQTLTNLHRDAIQSGVAL